MTQAEVIKACPRCPKCDGKPAIKYEPGCLYTFCILKHDDCPMAKAVPDYDPELMVEELNNHKTKHALSVGGNTPLGTNRTVTK